MPVFRTKPRFVEARQVPSQEDYDDIKEFIERCIRIASWCGGKSYMMHSGTEPGYYYPDDPGTDHILVPTTGFVDEDKGDSVANPGDWIVRTAFDKETFVLNDQDFREKYEEVTE